MKNWFIKYLSPYLYYRAFSRALFTLYGIVIQELGVAVGQFFSFRHPIFSTYHLFKQCGASLTRIFLGRSLKYSYGYTSEDRIIESILKPIITQKGFYVDVGCNHPVFHSNSFLFYKRGWRGICIDANQKLIEQHKKFRPRDKAITALISDQNQERDFYIFTNDVLSSTETYNTTHHSDLGQDIKKVSMSTSSLTSILDEHAAPEDFDFLSIDVEEHDYSALKSLDLSRYRPRLIIIELEDFPIANPPESEVLTYLETKGYLFHGFVWKNAYFLKK